MRRVLSQFMEKSNFFLTIIENSEAATTKQLTALQYIYASNASVAHRTPSIVFRPKLANLRALVTDLLVQHFALLKSLFQGGIGGWCRNQSIDECLLVRQG